MKPLFVLLVFTLLLTANAASSIFEFASGEAGWFVRNDAVMGGISSSQFVIINGVLSFSGGVRLENDGGFAGVRSFPRPSNLAGFSGVKLRVRGDGKRYALQLVTASTPRVTYRAVFSTQAGQWTEVNLPFSAFRPTRSGNLLAGPTLDTRTIQRFGLTVGNGRAERFRLEVDWIRAF